MGTTSTADEESKKLGELPNDLPRNSEGRALIGDPRNDENLIVAQLHLVFMKFHNRVVDAQPDWDFEEVRRFVTWHYQRLILDDFLPRIADETTVGQVLAEGPRSFRFEEEPFMPVEFSAAAYRLHTMVRDNYDYNRLNQGVPLAVLRDITGQSSSAGAVPVPSKWVIDWSRFFDLEAGKPLNFSRRLGPLLGQQLGKLTVPGGTINLASLNLLRGLRLGLPTGQNVALALGFAKEEILSPEQVASGLDGAFAATKGLHVESPLWYYLMKEAAILGRGERLGPAGSRLVAEVFVGVLNGDSRSVLAANPQWIPEIPTAEPQRLTMTDILRFVADEHVGGS